MRLLWILVLVVLPLQITPHDSGALVNASISIPQELIFPIAFTPLELRKPASNYSWTKTLEDLTFKDITKFVLELEGIDLPGHLDTLEVEVTLNGASSSQVFTDGEYSFSAPTQVAMVVDTSVRKVDSTFDLGVLLKMQWSLSDAGVKITAADFVSFDPQPSFGEDLQKKVPLLVDWNVFQIGGIPPSSLYFITTGFFGNASGSNRLILNIYIETTGVESPWCELFVINDRLYQGSEESKWINTTMSSEGKNWAETPLTLEYHPHRNADRHKQVAFYLEVYAQFVDYVDTQAAERERLLGEMPKISEILGGILTINAIFLPLLYFRKQRLEERKRRTAPLVLTDEREQ
ncbi:MAG: hypothetical protein ACXADX_12190 [Candidatus Hodarchaeales archaeon]|jgi:hypothetical protein